MGSYGTEKALSLLRRLPRIAINNVRPNPGSNKKNGRNRGIYGGKTHGCGQKGSGQRQNFMPIGYETGNTPFYLRFPRQYYYAGHHTKMSYIPLEMDRLQMLIDTKRVRTDIPIDISQLMAAGIFKVDDQYAGGFMLEEGQLERFSSCINLEVQWASEATIAAVERHGGTINVAYYDPIILQIAVNPVKFFKLGVAIPRRMLPPQNLIEYYSDPKNRGYLADPSQVATERFVLSQKYGYPLHDLGQAADKELLLARKDPRQVFYGLEPGWVINMIDKTILKPLDPELKEFYAS